MKLTSLRQTNRSLDQTDACSVAVIADESQYLKNGFVVLRQNGFRKQLPTNVLRIPQLPSSSRSGSVISQEHCKSHQVDNDRSPAKNLVPLPCEMATESEKSSVKTELCENDVVIYTDSRLPQDKCRQRLEPASVAHHCSSDKSQGPSLNRNEQFNSAVNLSSSSTSASVVCSGSVQCKWNKCGCEIASDMLLEHIRIKHVATQLRFSDANEVNAEEQSFVCLWNGCKVYNRPSCVLTWLERHILSHLDKPYCCIVDGCGARFASQAMLERHVNGHFSGTCSSLAVSRSLRKADSVVKLAKKRKPRTARPYPGYCLNIHNVCNCAYLHIFIMCVYLHPWSPSFILHLSHASKSQTVLFSMQHLRYGMNFRRSLQAPYVLHCSPLSSWCQLFLRCFELFSILSLKHTFSPSVPLLSLSLLSGRLSHLVF